MNHDPPTVTATPPTGAGFRPRYTPSDAAPGIDREPPPEPATGTPGPARTPSYRGWLLLAALLWLSFCIYGSLVPLTYRPLEWDVAWQRFEHIRYLQLGIGSRADWVANILLFIPLGFLWTGVMWPRKGIVLRLLAASLVFTLAALLSLSIEFTQLYFPPRTVSQNDIIAEAVGALIGIALWWSMGPALLRWIAGWHSVRSAPTLARRLLGLYLVLLFGYNLLPLDLTISPVEVYHKWQLGRVVLVPFSYGLGSPAEWFYALAADIVVWIPVGLLLLLGGRQRPLAAWSRSLAAVAALEAAQLLVWSRVSDTTDLITGAIGAAIGVLIAVYWNRRSADAAQHAPHARGGISHWLGSATLFLAWTLVLAAVFWYPFDFQLDWAFLRQRFAGLERSPLHIYYYGTEFRAVTEVIHKVGFFLPLGALLAWPRGAISSLTARRLFDLMAVLLLPSVALLIELGQVALPGKYPDSSDWVLETIGALTGYFGLLFIRRRIAPDTSAADRPGAGTMTTDHPGR